MLYNHRREPQAVHEQAEAVTALCTEQGFPYCLARGTTMQGWASGRAGPGSGGHGADTPGPGRPAGHRDSGIAAAVFSWPARRGVWTNWTGQRKALPCWPRPWRWRTKLGSRWTEAELHRLKGELLLSLSADNHAEAEGCLHQALAVARRQQAKTLELRAATSLGRLWQQQGKRTAAHQLLAEIYGWFTEGFDTVDLQDAKALLEELA